MLRDYVKNHAITSQYSSSIETLDFAESIL